MQQRVATGDRRASRPTPAGGTHAPSAPRKKVSAAAKVFYFMRWAYHFITPIGMIGIIWGVLEAANGSVDRAWPIIVGSGIFTFCANYFNKAR